MWIAVVAAQAIAADVSVGAGVAAVGSSAHVQISPSDSERVRVGLDLGVRTTGGWASRPELWVLELEDDEMLVQPLLGPGFEIGLGGPLYLSTGIGFDVLAPARAAKLLIEWDTIFPWWFDGLMIYPAALTLNAVAMSQLELALGVSPAPALSIEAGVWPTTALLLPVVWPGPETSNTLRELDLLTAIRPGVQVVARF